MNHEHPRVGVVAYLEDVHTTPNACAIRRIRGRRNDPESMINKLRILIGPIPEHNQIKTGVTMLACGLIGNIESKILRTPPGDLPVPLIMFLAELNWYAYRCLFRGSDALDHRLRKDSLSRCVRLLMHVHNREDSTRVTRHLAVSHLGRICAFALSRVIRYNPRELGLDAEWLMRTLLDAEEEARHIRLKKEDTTPESLRDVARRLWDRTLPAKRPKDLKGHFPEKKSSKTKRQRRVKTSPEIKHAGRRVISSSEGTLVYVTFGKNRS